MMTDSWEIWWRMFSVLCRPFLWSLAFFLVVWLLVHIRRLIRWKKEPFPWKKACIRLVTICILPSILVGTVCVCISLGRWRHFAITKYPFENPLHFENSKWVCEEADAEFYMDRHRVFLGVREGDPEILHLDADVVYLTRAGEVAGFSIRKTGTTAYAEASEYVEAHNRGEVIFQGRFLGFNEDEMVFRLRRKDLPLWGFTKPVELHFVREELTEPLDFNGPDCELCN